MSANDSGERLAMVRHGMARRSIAPSGTWLRAGFVALSVEAVALILLATGEAAPWIALSIAIAAGAYARWSWRRARTALDAENAATR